MKKLSLYFIALLGILALVSCDKGTLGPVVSSSPTSPKMSSSAAGQNYKLDKSNAQDTLFTLDWSAPDYGFPSAPTYTVQMAEQGTDFANPIQLAKINKKSFSITVNDMNSLLISNGFPADLNKTFDFRVIASVASSQEYDETSDPISMSLTPYPPFPSIYVSGGYTSNSGYDIAPALVSTASDSTYSGFVYFDQDNSNFTFTELRSSTSGKSWGDNGADGTLEEGGANIQVANAGYYMFSVDLKNMSYTMTKTDWGIIGDATSTGWSSDQNMTYDKNKKVWSITLDLTANSIKFRANDAWAINYGDNGADGFLDLGGDNISVPSAGNYTVTMDLSGYYRTYTLSKN
ncbi:MAG TPA: SusE domain-containing protein [Balneolaceae bacterium]|nr:SusE domain-containing protein [Balneolaceae bacterium]